MDDESQSIHSIDLLIKTSDQQCPDCNIKCNLDWTIYDLKDHLSVFYPDDLKKDDQKLIYGGKILTDDTVLSSIFNTNNDFNYSNVLHLVRKNFKNSSHSFNDNKNASTNLIKTSMPDSITSPGALSTPAARQEYLLNLHQMHQAYFQYMQSYQQLYYNQNLFQESSQNERLATLKNGHNTHNVVEEQIVNEQPHPQPEEEPQQPQIVNQRNRIQNELLDNREMDYFEIFCAIIRICIIALLFYSYSSFIRFAIVIFTIVLVRLFKYFRTTRRFNFERREEQRQEPLNMDNNEDANTNSSTDNQMAILSDNPSNDRNSSRDILHTVWLFITSFITSLIPDTVEVA